MDEDHPYHQLEIPGDAPFELRPAPGKGWGAFATRDIQRGAVILAEKAIFVMHKVPPPDTDHYALSILEHDVRDKVQTLSPAAKRLFFLLRKNASPVLPYRETFAANCFKLHGPGHGVYVLLSPFNHSCIPNSTFPTSKTDVLALHAHQDIVKGEEITFCYNENGMDVMTRGQRQKHLWPIFSMKCKCKACLPGTALQPLSDMRRTIMRGLMFLSSGVDEVRQLNPDAWPIHIIADPVLRKEAKEFRIPHSLRFICHICFLLLSEEEGTLTDEARSKLERKLVIEADWFQTYENARIARSALRKRTLREKLVVAFSLWERKDAADLQVTGLYMMMRLKTME